MDESFFDVLIVGAGLSGVGAACHLESQAKGRSYAILEARDRLGGTWDLFRYPGVRSDSDMYTLGYGFRPWVGRKSIADGADILAYIADTAHAYGVDRKIRYGWRVVGADWSGGEALWRVSVQAADGAARELTCRVLFICAGYYSYARGHEPDIPGKAQFAGPIVHPQAWPQDLDYTGRRVVVIGSGATAVTLVPELARRAAHVTMLQRSPTYVVARPSEDAFPQALARRVPAAWAYTITRWRNLLLQLWWYRLARRKPEAFKARVVAMARRAIGEAGEAADFTPSYNPWDQRLCLAPDGDLFRAIRQGSVSVVTATIETFTKDGLRLNDGRELAADIVVAATGLEVEVWGGIAVSVEGRRIEPGRTLTYKGVMYEGVPNLVTCFGYTNASWTLKSDLTARFVCRLLQRMAKTGASVCTPVREGPDPARRPWLDFTSGYVRRALDRLPKQGDRQPWRLNQNYLFDLWLLRFAPLADGALRFTGASGR